MLKSFFSFLFFSFSAAVASAQLNQHWVAAYGGTAGFLDYGRAMQIDFSGNAFIAGTVSNNGTGKDIAVVKYNSAGALLWAATYDDSLNLDDWAYALVIDSAGNCYTAGFISTLTEGKNFITLKIDSSGIIQWAAAYNGSANLDDVANDITIDPWGNIIVAGISKDTATADDYAVVKYNTSGIQMWAARYDGPASGVDDARTIASDKDGNIYVSGGSTGNGTDYDFATVKYDSAGAELWAARYDGPANGYDLVYYQGALTVDSLQNVYITGYSTGADSTLDYATLKYDSAGTQLWVARYFSEAGGTDYADAIALDHSFNVYVTGGSYMTPNNFDFVTVKYDPLGNQLWTASYNGTANDWDEAYSLVTDDSLNVYITGRSVGTGTSADFATLKYNASGIQQNEARYSAGSGYDWPFVIRLSQEHCVYVGGSLGSTISDMGVIKYCPTPVGIQEADLISGNVFIYPNPAVQELKINNAELRIEKIEIFDFSGREVLSSKVLPFSPERRGSGDEFINVSSLAPGSYFITFTDEKKNRVTKRFVKM